MVLGICMHALILPQNQHKPSFCAALSVFFNAIFYTFNKTSGGELIKKKSEKVSKYGHIKMGQQQGVFLAAVIALLHERQRGDKGAGDERGLGFGNTVKEGQFHIV